MKKVIKNKIGIEFIKKERFKFSKIFEKSMEGFTLIELLVVIALIGLLSGTVLVSLSKAREQARDVARQTDMRQVATAQEMYYTDNEVYDTDDGTNGGNGGIKAIGSFLSELHDVQCPGGSCSPGASDYTWIDNTGAGDDARFCIYATLEKGTYFAVSDKGAKELSSAPTSLDDCW